MRFPVSLFTPDLLCDCRLGLLQAQGRCIDYERAEKFLPWNISKLVFDAEVFPNWRGHTNRFW